MTGLAAPCPLHLEGQVTFTCVRCGTFGCDVCRSPLAGPLCSTCGSRATAPGLPVMETLREGFHFLVRRPALPLSTALVYAAAGVVTLRLTQLEWQLVWAYFFGAVVDLFIIRYVGDQLTAPGRPLRASVRDALRRLPAGLGSSLLVGVAVLLGGLAFLVPGIFLLVVLSLAAPAVVLQGASAADSLALSWQLTRRHRWQLGLLVSIVGSLLLAVGMAVVALQSGLEERGLKNPLLDAVLDEALTGPGRSLMTTVLTLGYLKLAGQRTDERQGQ